MEGLRKDGTRRNKKNALGPPETSGLFSYEPPTTHCSQSNRYIRVVRRSISRIISSKPSKQVTFTNHRTDMVPGTISVPLRRFRARLIEPAGFFTLDDFSWINRGHILGSVPPLQPPSPPPVRAVALAAQRSRHGAFAVRRCRIRLCNTYIQHTLLRNGITVYLVSMQIINTKFLFVWNVDMFINSNIYQMDVYFVYNMWSSIVPGTWYVRYDK